MTSGLDIASKVRIFTPSYSVNELCAHRNVDFCRCSERISCPFVPYAWDCRLWTLSKAYLHALALCKTKCEWLGLFMDCLSCIFVLSTRFYVVLCTILGEIYY